MSSLKGVIKHITYRNEDNDYHIIKIITEDEKIETVVGYFPPLSEGVLYEFEGDFISHPKFGLQFKATHIKRLSYEEKEGLITYLSSSLFSGIGPKTAEKIVELLGAQAIEKIIENPNVLVPVGLSVVRMQKLALDLKQQRHQEAILVTLYQYGLSSKMAMKLISFYGDVTLEKLNENPYRLMEDIDQIGFLKSDHIAKMMGILEEDPRRIEAAILYTFDTRGFQQGDTYLTLDQIEAYMMDPLKVTVDIQPYLQGLVLSGKIKQLDHWYSLTAAYFSSQSVAQYALLIKDKTMPSMDDLTSLIELIQTKKRIEYTDVQKEAITKAVKEPFTIITGGPGTGKTTIIDGIVSLYQSIHHLEDPVLLYDKIGLMAPTGRAAKRMRQVLDFPAKTIHSTLGYSFDGKFMYDQFQPLPFDLIIVDEASMIDIFLAKRLLDAVKQESQIIFVGDVDQLPSVGPGQFLQDLIMSEQFSVVRLNQIHRQAKHSKIVKLSRQVNEMSVSYEDLVSEDDVYIYKAFKNQVLSIMTKQIEGAMLKGYQLLEDIQVLIPVYKGDFGIDKVNEHLQKTFNDTTQISMKYGDKTFYPGDKVIQLLNNPKLQIMNGDIGMITSIKKTEDDALMMTVNFDDQTVTYDHGDLEQLNLAYAMSIHKAQGSEYKIVIMPFLKNYVHMFKKELIYTAMTRAQKVLLLLGDVELLIYASNHLSEKRQTLLLYFLTQKEEVKTKTLSPYDFME
jgi:exodeoxyribonuclease V alpha subunit